MLTKRERERGEGGGGARKAGGPVSPLGEPWLAHDVHTCFSARNARRAAGLKPCRLNYGQTAFHAAHRPGETLKIHSKKGAGRGGGENASTSEPVLYTYIQLHSLKPRFFFTPLFVPVSHSRLPLL